MSPGVKYGMQALKTVNNDTIECEIKWKKIDY